jgi:hypothetical protein
MKAKALFFLFLFFLPTVFISAQQKKRYDIFSYTAPANFITRDSKDKLYFEKKEAKNYCQLVLYPAVTGQSDIEKDFVQNWNFFSRNPSQKVSDPETKKKDEWQGWQRLSGSAQGIYGKQSFNITVSTFTKGSITYFVAAVFTDKKFIPEVQAFVATLLPDERIFEQRDNGNQINNSTTGNTQLSGSMTITKFTTNFDDGWTSTITNEYVKVFKNGTEVRLYYLDPTVDKQRLSTTNTFESYYWDVIVKTAFNTGQAFIREKEQYSYGKEDIWEALVTNKQTGKAGYLGMRLVFNNGNCRPIVVIAPDKNTYYRLFGTDEDFTKMHNYNKFGVAQKDLIGKWKSFDASSMGYYSIYTGDYAGTSTASTNDEFVFNSNGTYQSEHTGTITFNGLLSHGKSAYKGIFSVKDWNLTASNREANDPGEFFCQFEAVKGGYMLRLMNKTFTGETLALFKSK